MLDERNLRGYAHRPIISWQVVRDQKMEILKTLRVAHEAADNGEESLEETEQVVAGGNQALPEGDGCSD